MLDAAVGIVSDMLAMNIYYEMTWHGWPECTLAVRDKILDLVEELERGLGIS
jgi:hypothetical protein